MSNLKVPSRNNEGEATAEHPSRYRISFNGSTGEWGIYDKVEKEKHMIPHDKFVFMPLIRTSGAAGYYQPANMGYWSNEIQDSRTEPLEVKGNDGETFITGIWKNIKEQCNARKIDFIANLYAAVKLGNGYEIATIELKTTALVEFGRFSKELANETGKSNAVYNVAVKVSKLESKKNGAVNYVTPTFKAIEVSPEGMQQTGKLADICVAFLEDYFSQSNVQEAPKEDPKVEPKREPVQTQQASNTPPPLTAEDIPSGIDDVDNGWDGEDDLPF